MKFYLLINDFKAHYLLPFVNWPGLNMNAGSSIHRRGETQPREGPARAQHSSRVGSTITGCSNLRDDNQKSHLSRAGTDSPEEEIMESKTG